MKYFIHRYYWRAAAAARTLRNRLLRVARGPKFETQVRPAARIFITRQPAARHAAAILVCNSATLRLLAYQEKSKIRYNIHNHINVSIENLKIYETFNS